MKASYLDQASLLQLAQFDQRESALRHQRGAHPAFAKLRELAERYEDLQRAAISQSAVMSDIARDAEFIEKEIAKVVERHERQQGRIDANQVPLRDISALEHEIAQMEKRQEKLENDLLEVEEKREAAARARQAIVDEAQAIKDDVEETKARFAADVAQLEEELRELVKNRADLAEGLPSDLLDAYERSRSVNGAFAVLELRNNNAMGMAAELPPAELQRIRLLPEDEVYWTEDTRAIVVRTRS